MRPLIYDVNIGQRVTSGGVVASDGFCDVIIVDTVTAGTNARK